MVKRLTGQLSSSRRKKHSRAKGGNEEGIIRPRARGPWVTLYTTVPRHIGFRHSRDIAPLALGGGGGYQKLQLVTWSPPRYPRIAPSMQVACGA